MPVFELEEFPEPKPVRVNDRSRVHLAELPNAGGTLCGQVGELTVVELTLEEIDELPVDERCRRCASAATGQARVKRLAR